MPRRMPYPFALLLLSGVFHAAAAQQAPLRAVTRADIDTTCLPCDNFYRFAAGGWTKNTPIPAANAVWSSFDEATERNYLVVRGILDAAAKAAPTTRDLDQRRLGYFYATCVDSAAIEAGGASPLRADFAGIDAIADRSRLVAEIAKLQATGRSLVFVSGAVQDDIDSRRMIFQISQGGLGLPERDYYFKSDSATRAIRAAYQEYIAAMLTLTGVPATTAAAQASDIMALETALAEASFTQLQLRDPKTQNHMMSLADADRLTPGLSWGNYARAIGAGTIDSLNVAHLDFFGALGRELAQRPLATWRAYLRFRLANAAAPTLSSAFVNTNFRFTSRLNGARELLPRWRRCLAAADRFVTDPLGREYVKVAYTPEAKATMDAMIDNLMIVYKRRLERLPWMSEATRQEALKKLSTIGRKIGYPTSWRDYSALDVQPRGWYGNATRALAFEYRRTLAKLGKPVDRGEWTTTTPTVNAFYSPSNNVITFPAGRMQPPFFHPSFDLAANYGGIGATIGHEVSHGFDDQGRKYDAAGNLRDWWTVEDAARFTDLAGQMERQYGSYSVLDGLHLNGKQTLGENIADNAGISIAFEALQLALQGKPRELIDGFTPEQRFFLGWAQARRQTWRDQALRLTIQTGVHSPGEFRVDGPLSNLPEFAAAWGCKKGDAMVRDTPIKIW